MDAPQPDSTSQSYVPYESLTPIDASVDVNALIQWIRTNLEEHVAWTANLAALNSLRQLNKFNTQHMNEICGLVWPSLVKCMSSNKTVVAKTSLIFMQELFHHCGASLADPIILSFEPALIQKVHCSQNVLKQEAQKAYQLLIEKVIKDATIVAISNSTRSKNAAISELSYKALERLVSLVGASLIQLQPNTFKEMLSVVMAGLDGKRAEVTKSSENIIKLLYQGLGDANFSTLITAMMNEGVIKQEDLAKLRKVFEVKEQKPKEPHLSDALRQAKMQKQMADAQQAYAQAQAYPQGYPQGYPQSFPQGYPQGYAMPQGQAQAQPQYYQG